MAEADDTASDGRLIMLSTVAGMGAIIALPLSVSAPGVSVLLVFSVPLMLAVVGRLRSQPALVGSAVVVLLMVGAAVLLQVDALSLLAVVVLFAGPILAVILVGTLLRERDQVAAGAFLLGGTIAVVAGFTITGISRQGATVIVALVAFISLGLTASRLAKTEAGPRTEA